MINSNNNFNNNIVLRSVKRAFTWSYLVKRVAGEYENRQVLIFIGQFRQLAYVGIGESAFTRVIHYDQHTSSAIQIYYTYSSE